MNPNRVKMILGLALFVLGIWRLAAGPAASPWALLPGTISLVAAVVSLVVGYWLYRANCGS
jgi:CBS-domain-containing membrane protein